MTTQVLMKTPDSRWEFERNLYLLKDKIKNNKFFFARRIQVAIDGLLRARYLPNGRTDLLSIDESLRSMANTLAQMEGREDAPEQEEAALSTATSTAADLPDGSFPQSDGGE